MRVGKKFLVLSTVGLLMAAGCAREEDQQQSAPKVVEVSRAPGSEDTIALSMAGDPAIKHLRDAHEAQLQYKNIHGEFAKSMEALTASGFQLDTRFELSLRSVSDDDFLIAAKIPAMSGCAEGTWLVNSIGALKPEKPEAKKCARKS